MSLQDESSSNNMFQLAPVIQTFLEMMMLVKTISQFCGLFKITNLVIFITRIALEIYILHK